MFTGLVEETGKIKRMLYRSEQAVEMTIAAEKVLTDIQIGDSIAVNGICLTVVRFTDRSFQVDMMPETIRATSLSLLKEGSIVNLERSLLPSERIGGHFVTGHVDTTANIVEIEHVENAVYFTLQVPPQWMPFMILKGSVAVDGISLTIFSVVDERNEIKISIIPHTLRITNLKEKNVGDLVNIECDLLAKHVHRYLNTFGHLTERDEGEEHHVSYD